METLRIVPFDARHVEGMKIESEPMLESMREQIVESACKGEAFTGFLRGSPLGCAGISPLWEGCGEAWCFFTPSFYTSYRGTLIAMIRKFRTLACPYDRVQTIVNARIPNGMRFAEMFGFRVEGFMKRYYRGEDYFMLSLFPKEEGWCGK